MSNPLVSIIVPTYNRPDFLRRALESIAAQTHRHYEAIVINDGGEDVAAVVAGFQKTRYINLPVNSGLPAARNAGLRVAKGDWIAYLDDDDWFYPMHLSTLLAWTHVARFIYTDADSKDMRGRVKLYMSVDPEPGNILSRNITPVCCVLHDRWLIPEVGFFDETLPNHEDWDLWIRMSQVTEMHHIKAATCCVDRSHRSMLSDTDAVMKGMLFVKYRYRSEARREGSAI